MILGTGMGRQKIIESTKKMLFAADKRNVRPRNNGLLFHKHFKFFHTRLANIFNQHWESIKLEATRGCFTR
ncbi:hypothetical protein SAMN05660297_02410 [Natronincola peptidivorans]|uniref:Uncharacterized protein n=1 Tax=Natronincola peptidivorans TaxID=426128 RepID=A0A1I0EHS3_9FIRM|nr:hypothetical protein SAMN05660297_02410 [Natronincola peptidivorans]